MKRSVAVVVGTRPDAIKMAPVVLELRKYPDRFGPTIVATAQHREMLQQVLGVFALKPDVDLDVMREDQGLGELTARLVTRLESLWRSMRPDVVLVQGDTTSTFAAALAAYYVRVPVGHVEAGLRTGDKYAPFPEELNRRLVDTLADYHFAPTGRARENLVREGIPAACILVTGNTGIDALRIVRDGIRADRFVADCIDPAVLTGRKVVLVTAHRRESFGTGVRNICEALRTIARTHPDTAIVYPVHPNPNVRRPVTARLGDLPNIHLTDPLDYRSFVYFLERCDVILTDSGGIQEEAASFGKPVLVMRDATERGEAVEAGVAELVGTRTPMIVERTLALLESATPPRPIDNPFGDGYAASRIVNVLGADRRPEFDPGETRPSVAPP